MKNTITNSMAVLALTAFTPFVAFDSPQEVEELVEEITLEEHFQSFAGDNLMEVYPKFVPTFKAEYKAAALDTFRLHGVNVTHSSEPSDMFPCFWGEDNLPCWAVDMEVLCNRPYHSSIGVVTVRQVYIAGVMVGTTMRQFPSMEWEPGFFSEENYEMAMALLSEGKTCLPLE